MQSLLRLTAASLGFTRARLDASDLTEIEADYLKKTFYIVGRNKFSEERQRMSEANPFLINQMKGFIDSLKSMKKTLRLK